MSVINLNSTTYVRIVRQYMYDKNVMYKDKNVMCKYKKLLEVNTQTYLKMQT